MKASPGARGSVSQAPMSQVADAQSQDAQAGCRRGGEWVWVGVGGPSGR